ncbi:MAG: alpha/beta fold hydrolase [Gordonia paraffinivorans]
MSTPRAEPTASTTSPADLLAPLDRTSPLWPGSRVEIDGRGVFLRRVPRATDTPTPAGRALYVHGLGGSSLNWTDLGEVLGPVLDGWAMDLPGFGFSDPPVGDDYSLTTMVESVIAVLDHLGGAHLVGNSLGGAIVARVAAARPDLVTTLTLISPAFPDLRPRVRRLSFVPLTLAQVPRVGPAVFGYLGRAHPERQVAQTLREIMVDPSRLGAVRTTQAVEHAIARAGLPWAPVALSRTLTSLVTSWVWMSGRAHWRTATAITSPTLVIWGGRDKLVSSAIAPRLVRAIPNSRLVMFGAVGHVCQMEIPVETAREIARHVGAGVASATP